MSTPDLPTTLNTADIPHRSTCPPPPHSPQPYPHPPSVPRQRTPSSLPISASRCGRMMSESQPSLKFTTAADACACTHQHNRERQLKEGGPHILLTKVARSPANTYKPTASFTARNVENKTLNSHPRLCMPPCPQSSLLQAPITHQPRHPLLHNPAFPKLLCTFPAPARVGFGSRSWPPAEQAALQSRSASAGLDQGRCTSDPTPGTQPSAPGGEGQASGPGLGMPVSRVCL